MPLELQLQEVVSHPVWVLRPKLQSSGAAINTLNSRGISLTPRNAYRQGKEIYGFADCLFLTRSYISPLGLVFTIQLLRMKSTALCVPGKHCTNEVVSQILTFFFLIHK